MKNTIIRYKEINSFFEAINSELRTDIPEFCVFPLNKITKNVVLAMKPYQKDFNHITLVLKSKNSGIQIDEQHIQKKDNFLFFLSTKHIYSWQRDQNIKGYTIFFKSSFLNFYAEQFEIDFSFFCLGGKNII